MTDTHMKGLIIRGGRLLDPAQGIDKFGDLLIIDGKVAALGEDVSSNGDIISAQGMVVCPGFIDLHCHLRQPGYEEKETVETGTQAAARGGFTTICAMPNTTPPPDTRETLEAVRAIVAEKGAVRVLPLGCISRGREGKEPAAWEKLASAGAIALSDDGSPVTDNLLMQQALYFSRHAGIPIVDHCEDAALFEGGQMNAGSLSARLGLRGIPPAAEYIMVQRDLALAGLTGGHIHIAHVSTEGSVALIRQAKGSGINVTAEVTPHHLTLTESAVTGGNTAAKVNPPLRTEKAAAILLEALKQGIIDCIATDHAPHTPAEKRRSFTGAPFGISGLETAFGSLMGLVHAGKLSLPDLISALTWRPAKIISRADLGTLRTGSTGDITIFDPAREWTVNPAEFASRGKNTPLEGAVLRGRVMATVAGGKVVYRDPRIKIIIRAG